MRAAAPLLLFSGRALGHGHMNHPPSRQGGTLDKAGLCHKGQCIWFSQAYAGTKPLQIEGPPTLPEKYRSYNLGINSGNCNDTENCDWTAPMPWRAPGSVDVYGSGCGVFGGGPIAEQNGGSTDGFPEFKQGQDSLTLPPLKTPPTVWKRGAAEEAIFAINANHGGGYSWRLCKKNPKKTPFDGITEECFQKTPLKFAGDTSWVQFGDDKTKRTAFKTPKFSEGTHPAGSEWAMIPIPACRVPRYCNVTLSSLIRQKLPWHAHYEAGPVEANLCGGLHITSHHSCLWKPETKDGHDSCPECANSTAATPSNPGAPWGTQFPPIAGDDIVGFGGCMDCTNTVGKDCTSRGGVNPEDSGKPEAHCKCIGCSVQGWGWLFGQGNKDDHQCGTGAPCSHLHGRDSKIPTGFDYNIVDNVQVPQDIEAGDYTLSWRWDCEESKQVWQTCSDIVIQ